MFFSELFVSIIMFVSTLNIFKLHTACTLVSLNL